MLSIGRNFTDVAASRSKTVTDHLRHFTGGLLLPRKIEIDFATHSDHIRSLQVQVHDGVDDGDPIYTLSPVVLDDPLPTLSLPDASSSPPAQLPVALPPSAFQQPHGHGMIEYMRAALSLPSDVPVNLWSVPDPPGENVRPGASLQVLISLAICSSEKKMLPLQGIHQAIAARFPYYRRYDRWQGSIRHALSLYSIFKMHNREGGDRGRGSYWTLDIARAEKERYKRPRTRSDGGAKKTRTKKKPARLRNADDDSDAATEGSQSTRTRLEQAREISSPALAGLGDNRDVIHSGVLSSEARDLQGPIRASRTLWRQASANPTALTVSPASVEAGARRAGGRAGSGKQPRHGGKDIL
ncbi:fork head domain-containing protein [Mycena pura]|uniref:Fork head domain-containing protein n=1 Tax=Mycena pura TaxID=153505 RepID=A0AAD6VUI3_9AGAR|nr:fork head domain-containing protein [Mycena pura]